MVSVGPRRRAVLGSREDTGRGREGARGKGRGQGKMSLQRAGSSSRSSAATRFSLQPLVLELSVDTWRAAAAVGVRGKGSVAWRGGVEGGAGVGRGFRVRGRAGGGGDRWGVEGTKGKQVGAFAGEAAAAAKR